MSGEGSAKDEAIGTRRGMFGISGSGDTSGYGRLVRPVKMPGSSPRPYGGYFDDIVDALDDDAVEKVVVDRGELTVFIHRLRLPQIALTLKNTLGFNLCLGVSGVHYPDDRDRELHAVYHFTGVESGQRLRIEVTAPDAEPHIPSLVSVYPTCDWHERETYDFFGIVFDGHPGLTRIEMPDDWEGHPQRKDYPLGGIPVQYKGATIAPPDERRSYN
ncbi:NADH-quinone oxidoreductase subunit C [Smaragdicoccus niigatensis]|uniref:NADH-quinone oxidoreductase subunit C n=1 Tax=Smaragdicoccus niigatensis TaxID=359359 RepID=UPI0003824D39|nr:NADH-quinone oxidoreductase subunit C [Smaragdicoccus niigatensis]